MGMVPTKSTWMIAGLKLNILAYSLAYKSLSFLEELFPLNENKTKYSSKISGKPSILFHVTIEDRFVQLLPRNVFRKLVSSLNYWKELVLSVYCNANFRGRWMMLNVAWFKGLTSRQNIHSIRPSLHITRYHASIGFKNCFMVRGYIKEPSPLKPQLQWIGLIF